MLNNNFIPNDKMAESLSYPDVNDVNKVVGMPKVVQRVERGRVIQDVVFDVTPLEQLNSEFTVDDFAIENLLANGANLTRVSADGVGSLEAIDTFTNSVGKVNDIVKSSKTE